MTGWLLLGRLKSVIVGSTPSGNTATFTPWPFAIFCAAVACITRRASGSSGLLGSLGQVPGTWLALMTGGGVVAVPVAGSAGVAAGRCTCRADTAEMSL